MQAFTNKFNISVNGNKTEVVINFLQKTPIIPDIEDGIATANLDFETTSVANLVMTSQCAWSLVSTLTGLLEFETNNDEQK